MQIKSTSDFERRSILAFLRAHLLFPIFMIAFFAGFFYIGYGLLESCYDADAKSAPEVLYFVGGTIIILISLVFATLALEHLLVSSDRIREHFDLKIGRPDEPLRQFIEIISLLVLVIPIVTGTMVFLSYLVTAAPSKSALELILASVYILNIFATFLIAIGFVAMVIDIIKTLKDGKVIAK